MSLYEWLVFYTFFGTLYAVVFTWYYHTRGRRSGNYWLQAVTMFAIWPIFCVAILAGMFFQLWSIYGRPNK